MARAGEAHLHDLAVRDLGVRRLFVGVQSELGVDALHGPAEAEQVRERRRLAVNDLVLLDVTRPEPKPLDDRLAPIGLAQAGRNDAPQGSVRREAGAKRLVVAALPVAGTLRSL